MLPLLGPTGTAICAYSIITASPTSGTANSSNDTALISTIATLSNGREAELWYTKHTIAATVEGRPATITVAEPVATSYLLSNQDSTSMASGKLGSAAGLRLLTTLVIATGLMRLLIVW